MESRERSAKKNENEQVEVEQDNIKEILDGERGQDDAKGTENNRKPRQEMTGTSENAQLSNQQAVEEDTPVPSSSDSIPLGTNTKDDNPLPSEADNSSLETDSKAACADKKLASSPHQGLSSSASSNHDKESIKPIAESFSEQNSMSVKPGMESSTGLDTTRLDTGSGPPCTEISTGNIDLVDTDINASVDCKNKSITPDVQPSMDTGEARVKSGAEASSDHGKGSLIPDGKPSTHIENGKVKLDPETSTGHDKVPVAETSVGREKGSLDPDTESPSDQEKVPDNAVTVTLTEHDNAPVHINTVSSREEPDKLDTETLTEHTDRPVGPDIKTSRDHDKGPDKPATETSTDHNREIAKLDAESMTDVKVEVPDSKVLSDTCQNSSIYNSIRVASEPAADAEKTEKKDSSEEPQRKSGNAESGSMKLEDSEPGTPLVAPSDVKSQDRKGGNSNNGVHKIDMTPRTSDGPLNLKPSFLLDDMSEGGESGTEEEQSAFMKELEHFFRERNMEFKPPKFYGEGLNCLKLWRAVTRLGGYDKVTSCKLWRQVGESFKPPKTCTTVSWTFRGFYEKALLDYERHKTSCGEQNIPVAAHSEPMHVDNQASGSGRARRDAAARAMQGWHAQRLLGNGEVSDPIIKDKNTTPLQKREKQLGGLGLLKRKKPSPEHASKVTRIKLSKPQLDVAIVDAGPPADWVKINVQRTRDCFEVYALVPGLLREEVRVQSDAAGRLVISGEPEHLDNPWGVTPFKKVVSLPSRIDPHQTSAVVTLNGQLFVRVPFEQSD